MKILKCASIIPELNSKNLEIPSENTKYGGKGPVKVKALNIQVKVLQLGAKKQQFIVKTLSMLVKLLQ